MAVDQSGAAKTPTEPEMYPPELQRPGVLGFNFFAEASIWDLIFSSLTQKHFVALAGLAAVVR